MTALILPAAAIATVFGYLLWRHRRTSIAVTTLLWAMYAVYEYLISLRVLCSGECNIRVDLFLIWPVLMIATAISITAAVRNHRRSVEL